MISFLDLDQEDALIYSSSLHQQIINRMKSLVSTAIYLLTLTSCVAQNSKIMYQVNNNASVFSTKTIIINARPEKVWAVLTNINGWSGWLNGITESKLNGDLKPNTTFDWKTGSTKIHSTLHTVEPYTEFGWTGKVYGIFAIHNWTFREMGDKTEVIVSESMEGFLTKFFKKSLNKTLERDMIKSLESLKLTCE